MTNHSQWCIKEPSNNCVNCCPTCSNCDEKESEDEMTTLRCIDCKNWGVVPSEEPCKTCLSIGRNGGKDASNFEPKEVK